MNKIRIIDLAIRNAKLDTPDNLLNPYESKGIDIRYQKYNWNKILAVTRDLETIFAIPPIILTPYIYNEPLSIETFYKLVDPMATTSNLDEIHQYVTVLKTLLILNYQSSVDMHNIFTSTNQNIRLHNRVARYESYLLKRKTFSHE